MRQIARCHFGRFAPFDHYLRTPHTHTAKPKRHRRVIIKLLLHYIKPGQQTTRAHIAAHDRMTPLCAGGTFARTCRPTSPGAFGAILANFNKIMMVVWCARIVCVWLQSARHKYADTHAVHVRTHLYRTARDYASKMLPPSINIRTRACCRLCPARCEVRRTREDANTSHTRRNKNNGTISHDRITYASFGVRAHLCFIAGRTHAFVCVCTTLYTRAREARRVVFARLVMRVDA